jgi:hypothetical protein
MDSSLSNKYNLLLNEYKQTYKQYLISLQDSSVNMVSVPNAFFWGESPLHIDSSLNSLDDCLQSCSSTTFCSGATYLKNQNHCSLRKGPGSIIPNKNNNNSDFAIVPSPLYYSYQLKNINQSLLDLNKQMMNSLQQSYTSYKENNQKQQQNHVILIEKNNSYLKDDSVKIKQMIKEEELMNAANENSQLVVKQQYYAYIIYLFVTILLIFLFIRIMFINNPEQKGGIYKKK